MADGIPEDIRSGRTVAWIDDFRARLSTLDAEDLRAVADGLLTKFAIAKTIFRAKYPEAHKEWVEDHSRIVEQNTPRKES